MSNAWVLKKVTSNWEDSVDKRKQLTTAEWKVWRWCEAEIEFQSCSKQMAREADIVELGRKGAKVPHGHLSSSQCHHRSVGLSFL
jgi:hypothetical protein